MPTPPDDLFPARDDTVRDDPVPFPAPPAAPGARDREAAFTAAFTAHYPAVLAFARRRIGDVAAEDVAAEVLAITRMAYAARLSRARRRLRHRLSEREHRVRGGTAADTGPDPDPDADRAPARLWAAPSPARSVRGDAR